MIGLGRNHSVHLIREIKAPHVPGGVVPDGGGLHDTLRSKLMRGEDVCTMIGMII